MKKDNRRWMAGTMSVLMAASLTPAAIVQAEEVDSAVTVEQTISGYKMSNDYFVVETGEYGQITSLQIVGDLFPTNYVMNTSNSQQQNTAAHQWFGELMFATKLGDAEDWTESMTSASTSGRTVELVDNKVIVTYENATEEKGIKDFKVIETYSLVDNQLRWEITVENTSDQNLTIGDFGIPLAFNEIWPGGEEIYETRVVDHSFVGKDSSYIYATRPSGQGQFLLMTPDVSTGAGFEYQDHWRTSERSADEAAWCQDQAGWANGLNVFYIHSQAISRTNRGYLENTSLELAAGESKTYAFNFTGVEDETDMKTTLYNEGIIDAVAVPGMIFSKDMKAKFYLHTNLNQDQIENIEIECLHDNNPHEGNPRTVSNLLEHDGSGESCSFVETKTVNGEQYHIYDLSLSCLGANNVKITYDGGKETVLQFYVLDKVEDALETHGDFMIENTQWNEPGDIKDQVFDDWMMDTKSKRGVFDGYWGWGDDWGLTHGEYLAEKNVYQPDTEQIEALDRYLDVAIWNGLMQEHQEDFKIHDFLMPESNTTPTYRGYAYPHIYNTYFSMYKIASKYPDMVEYKEEADTYLMRCYGILNALYQEGVAYNWETGLMGELTTPDIIEALEKEGHYDEAENIRQIMARKYDNFKNTKYPYGSEYSYDNTGEEAVYTLAKLNNDTDTENSNSMMEKIDWKTRACRGLQPIWYHYGNPTTICGENWWNFQYTASLAGYCMDDWLRVQDNAMTAEERNLAARVNYAGKLANLTAINSGQMDADPENIGTVSWTYQSEMGNLGGQGTGGGSLHNGWRQMAGEADLGLFGAMQILSSDVAVDPVFGVFGYGCDVTEEAGVYTVTPKDGLYTKLNFINEEIYIELDRDQYTQAQVNKNGTGMTLVVKNLEQTEHESDIEFTGLQAGNYKVTVDGEEVAAFTAVAGETSVVAVKLPAAATAEVVVSPTGEVANTAPVVEAGADQTIELSDKLTLKGSAKDDNMNLTYQWEATTTPNGATVTFVNQDKAVSDVTVDTVGTYVFTLTVGDGEYNSTDTITVVVSEDTPLPEVLASYSFDELDEAAIDTATSGTAMVTDNSSAGNDALIVRKPNVAEGKDSAETPTDKALSLDGTIPTGYVKLPSSLTKRVTDFTISADVSLDASQASGARLFEFGDLEGNELSVFFASGNQIMLNVTDTETSEEKTINTGLMIEAGYWKNITVTREGTTLTIYVDGIEAGKLEDVTFNFADFGETQRNYIGRSWDENIQFLNGKTDNFLMKSEAMTAAEVEESFGSDVEAEILSANPVTLVTEAGTAPVMPKTVKALYSNGIYRDTAVTWDAIPEENYQAKGSFTVNGSMEGTDVTATATVVVVTGSTVNVAEEATPSATYTNNDLGGIGGLNDGYDPASSNDRTHAVWHNWGHEGNQETLTYLWEEEMVINSTSVYFFSDGGGILIPTNAIFEYMDANGNWQPVGNPQSSEIVADAYNTTTFDIVSTRGLRMTLTPQAGRGLAVIEWQVQGYSDKIQKKELNAAILKAERYTQALYGETGWADFEAALAFAREIAAKEEATTEEVNAATAALQEAMSVLTVQYSNLAMNATPSASMCTSWNSVDAMNDGRASSSNVTNQTDAYGNWNGSSPRTETVTYTWDKEVVLSGTEIYWFSDGGGVQVPDTVTFEYKDAEGNWVEIPCAAIGTELDTYNTVGFPEKVTTTELRATLYRAGGATGIVEWTALGEYLDGSEVVDKVPLINAIDECSSLREADYTAESWTAFAEALQSAEEVVADSEATQAAVDAALEALNTARTNLVENNEDPGPTEPDSNIAAQATASASINRPEDLGGVAALNDGRDPEASNDFGDDRLAWHTWTQEGQDAWVTYTWDTPQTIDSTDAFYMTDGGGIQMPKTVSYEYLDENGEWQPVPNPVGLGTEEDVYNKTTFDAITTTSLRMSLSPQDASETGGLFAVGILEWKVYTVNETEVDKSELQTLVDQMSGKRESDYTAESWAVFETALENANTVLNNADATEQDVADAISNLQTAAAQLKTSGGTSVSDPFANVTFKTPGKWIQNSIGWWFQNEDGTWPANSWKLIDGKWYHFDEAGYMQIGWIEIPSGWYYLEEDGAMATGWKFVDDRWFYLNENGDMATGWKLVDNRWYYLNPVSDGTKGAMMTGWQFVGDSWYLMDASGAMMTGWQWDNDKCYYLTDNGNMLADTTTPDGYQVDASGAWIQ